MKNKFQTLFLLLLLKVLLEFCYVEIISPLFSYAGLILSISTVKVAESYLLFIVVVLFLIFLLEDKNIPSKIIIYLISVFLYTPLTSLFWLQDQNRVFIYCITLSLVFIILSVKYLPKIKFFELNGGEGLLKFITISMTISVYGLLILQGGIGRINLNLLDVYETRAGYSANNNLVLGYLLPWQAYGVNMLLIARGLYRKRYLFVTGIILMQVLLFSMTNFKSILFAPLILIGFHLFRNTKVKNKLLFIMSTGSVFIVILSLGIYYLFADIFILSVFVRRFFFVPADLHFVYYNFFDGIEKFELSHSIFSSIIENKYGLTPVKLVSFNYYNKDFAPNVGFFGDAYLNFGLLGIFAFSVLLVLLLKLIDSVSSSVPPSLSMSILIIPSLALLNSAFFTSLLTHGIIFTVFLLWLSNNYFRKTSNFNK